MSQGFNQEQLVVYKLGQLEEQVKANNDKIDEAINLFKEDRTETRIRLDSAELRLNKLENKSSWIVGAGAAVLFIFEIIKPIAMKWFHIV